MMSKQTFSWRILALILAVAGTSASCRSTGTRYHFTPSPLEALVQFEEDGPLAARVLVGIPGAERIGGRSSGHPELLVRLRIENRAESSMTVDPQSAVLLGSDLAQFGPARTDSDSVLEVKGGRSGAILLRFPFPHDGDLEAPGLTGVNLSFVLETAEGPVDMSVTLERDEPETVITSSGPPLLYGGGGFYYGNRWGSRWGRW